ncbi:MAG: hypothetical protein R3E97_09060 [Candidatus Eisenbacteria bacterium]
MFAGPGARTLGPVRACTARPRITALLVPIGVVWPVPRTRLSGSSGRSRGGGQSGESWPKGRSERAWQVVRAAAPGAVPLPRSARGRCRLRRPPRAGRTAVDPPSWPPEDDYLARERARNLCVAAPESVELWLVERAGTSWPELLARPDVSSDLAHWCLRALEAARAAASSPMVERTEVSR